MSHLSSRRSALLVVSALGVVLGLLGLAGVFAQATSQASAENNRYETGEFLERPDVDLWVAPATVDGESHTCGEFSQLLSTPLIDHVEPAYDPFGTPSPGDFSDVAAICLENRGGQLGTVTISADDIVDTDVACTGREAEADENCGEMQPGELSEFLRITTTDCATEELALEGTSSSTLKAMDATTGTPLDPGISLGRDEVVCTKLWADTFLLVGDELRASQSDESTWTFRFDLVSSTVAP